MAEDLRHSALHDLHLAGRAALGEVDGWLLPRVYENIKREYLSVKGTVAVMDRSHLGRLRLTGAKRLDLLHRLTTNDVRSLAPGQGARTALLTDKGRIVEDLRLHALEDSVLLVTSPNNQARVREILEKLRFRDDVTVEDVTTSTAMISLLGPQSAHLLEAVSSASGLAELTPQHSVVMHLGGTRVVAARCADVGGRGFNLIVPAGAAAAVWTELFAKGDPYGASPCGEEAYEMLRIELGLPRFGRELTEDHNPLEARLDETISWTKGCYVGQEVVARLDSRHKVSKLLVGVWLEPGPVPEAGCPIESPSAPGVAAGVLTSVAPSLDFRRVIGLGYVRMELAAAGTQLVAVSDGDRIGAEVSDLPFRPPGQPAQA